MSCLKNTACWTMMCAVDYSVDDSRILYIFLPPSPYFMYGNKTIGSTEPRPLNNSPIGVKTCNVGVVFVCVHGTVDRLNGCKYPSDKNF